jgi:mannose-6-phosphate isomerase-like protein (cupin superfamily)
MVRVWMLTALLSVAAAPAAAQSTAVTFVDSRTVEAALMKGGAIVSAAKSGYTVSGIRRTGPGQVEVHEKETDIFYVVEGAATIVTGGTVVGGRQTAPGQVRGTGVRGGETRHLAKGDIITIPAGVPHWFKEVSPSINYLTVKVIKP